MADSSARQGESEARADCRPMVETRIERTTKLWRKKAQPARPIQLKSFRLRYLTHCAHKRAIALLCLPVGQILRCRDCVLPCSTSLRPTLPCWTKSPGNWPAPKRSGLGTGLSSREKVCGKPLSTNGPAFQALRAIPKRSNCASSLSRHPAAAAAPDSMWSACAGQSPLPCPNSKNRPTFPYPAKHR